LLEVFGATRQVEAAPRRAEPLSFLTLQTVEGIVGSTDLILRSSGTDLMGKQDGEICKLGAHILFG
jgi:hypothetical protein